MECPNRIKNACTLRLTKLLSTQNFGTAATERAYSNFKIKMHRQKLLFIFLFFAPYVTSTEENSYLSKVENSLEKFCDITNFVTEVLEEFNDKHLGSSEWGKLLGYEEIKPKISDIGNS